MNRKILTLFIVLIIQIGLALGIYFNKEETGAFTTEERLLDFDAAAVDKILLEDGEEKTSLVVKKEKGVWVLPNHHGFPASSGKTEDFIKKISSIKKNWPVATTKSTAKRFKLGEENFEKKITFSMGDKESKALLVGTSPGFRKVHARLPGDDNIFAIEFSSYEAEVKPEEWTDNKFLKLKREEIAWIKTPSFSLIKKDDKFVLKDIKEEEEMVKEEANNLISRVADLSFQEVTGKEDKPEYRQSTPELTYTLEMKTGKRVNYTFSQPKDEEYFVLKVSSHDYFFKMSKYEVERLQEFKREKLVQTKKEEEKKGEESEES